MQGTFLFYKSFVLRQDTYLSRGQLPPGPAVRLSSRTRGVSVLDLILDCKHQSSPASPQAEGRD